jgi:hypothetical protein
MHALSWASIAFAVLFWWQVAPHILAAMIPAEWWMDVRNVVILDTIDGVPPAVVVDRIVHRDFNGSYRVNVRRAGEGGFSTWCTRGDGDVPYKAGEPPPADIDLNWWMGIPPNQPCKPPIGPGTYYAITDWRIPILGGYATLQITRQSNNFTVRAAP